MGDQLVFKIFSFSLIKSIGLSNFRISHKATTFSKNDDAKFLEPFGDGSIVKLFMYLVFILSGLPDCLPSGDLNKKIEKKINNNNNDNNNNTSNVMNFQ